MSDRARLREIYRLIAEAHSEYRLKIEPLLVELQKQMPALQQESQFGPMYVE